MIVRTWSELSAFSKPVLSVLALVASSVTLAIASPGPDKPPRPIEIFILTGTTQPGFQCDVKPNSRYASSLREIIMEDLPQSNEGSPLFYLVLKTGDRNHPGDPLGIIGDEVRRDGLPHEVMVAYLCNSGDTHSAIINGYVVQKTPPGILPARIEYDSGKTVQGTFDVLRAADLSGLFNTAKYDYVGFLPVTGDNADIINAQLERNLPFLTPITDAKPIQKLCAATAYHLLIAGQGSLATQNLDGFRTLATTASLFAFSQPQPWGSIWKLGGAGFALTSIPNTQGIPVQMFDCSNPRQMVAIGSSIIFADRNHPIPVIIGHSRQLAFGTDNKVQRKVLDLAISDLQNQLDCIVRRYRLQNAGDAIPDDDGLANSGWCTSYYQGLPKPSKVTATPITPMALPITLPGLFFGTPEPSPAPTATP